MSAVEFICPRCGARREHSVTSEQVQAMKRQGFGLCKTCYAPFKVNIDEKTGKWSFEPLTGSITTTVHSPLLNADFTYVEPVMPDAVLKGLFTTTEQLGRADNLSKPSTLSVIHNILDPEGAFFRQKSNKHINQWVKNDNLPFLERIFTTYPVQVTSILTLKGLLNLIAPFNVACPRCGIGIPRARANSCPICRGGVIQQKVVEDPLAILKLRLAKGEISEEQYDELKKAIESS